jgi:hypothetical protein
MLRRVNNQVMGIFVIVGMVAIGFNLMADKDSPYPFAPEEMQRFDRAHRLERIRNAGTVSAQTGVSL